MRKRALPGPVTCSLKNYQTCAGVSGIFAHPVLDGDELRGYDLDNAGLRVHDAVCLIEVTVRELIEQQGFKPISYWPLRELQRSRSGLQGEVAIARPTISAAGARRISFR